MQKRQTFFPIFIIFLILAGVVFFFSQNGIFKGMGGFFEAVTMPLQRITFGIFNNSSQTSADQFRAENLRLITELAKQKEIERENKALHDQFAISNPSPKQLLPAQIIGRHEDEIILDLGESDGVKTGQIVVFKDNIIGVVSQVSVHRSVVTFLTSGNISFTAKTVKTEATGVVGGKGSGEIILDKVVLSEKLEKDDIVVSKGDIDNDGSGYPPGLVVGKIVSVNKKASSLFQSAEVASLVDFSKLNTVFVLVQN